MRREILEDVPVRLRRVKSVKDAKDRFRIYVEAARKFVETRCDCMSVCLSVLCQLCIYFDKLKLFQAKITNVHSNCMY